MGIIQEQHPDRCRLFMQWKQMDWPILVDALNLYGVSAVPITYAIDEAGVVRAVNPKPAELEAFLASPAREPGPPPRVSRPDLAKLKPAEGAASAVEWGAYADALFLWGGDGRLGEAIDASERALRLAPGGSAWAWPSAADTTPRRARQATSRRRRATGPRRSRATRTSTSGAGGSSSSAHGWTNRTPS